MKRTLSLFLAVVMMGAMLVGCTPAEQPKEPGTPTDPTNPTTPVVDGKKRTEIVIGEASDVVNPFPHGSNDTSSNKVIRMMYDTLLYTNTKGELEPMLAEKWEVISDTEYKFYLRQDVKFHNGDPMTAEDVKYTLDKQREAARVKQFVEAISEVTIDNEYEITVKTAYPFAPLLGNLSGTQSSIISKKYHEEVGDDGYRDAPVGTGPMKYSSWTPNDSYVVVRNDEYWGKKAETTKITVRVIPEPSSRTIALETGAVDFVPSVPNIDINRVLENPDLKTHKQISTSISYLSFNTTKAPFDNVKVRQALSYATDKEAMVEVICEGYGIPMNTVVHSAMPGYVGDLNLYPYDIEKAKALMTEAGYPNGFTSKISTSGDERNRVAQLLQEDFNKIGVKLDIDVMEWGAFIEATSGKDHEMFILGWSAGYEPDSTIFPLFHSKNGGATGNRAWYSNPEVDTLIDQARQIISMDERIPMYEELQRKIMADAVWVPLFSKETVIAMNKNMEGVDISPVDSHIYVYSYINE